MSDALLAYYDPTRGAVILRRESGTEIAILDHAEANSLGTEVIAAAHRRDTGYAEFLAQESGLDLAAGEQSSYGSDEPDEQALADAEDAMRLLREAETPGERATVEITFTDGTSARWACLDDGAEEISTLAEAILGRPDTLKV